MVRDHVCTLLKEDKWLFAGTTIVFKPVVPSGVRANERSLTDG